MMRISAALLVAGLCFATACIIKTDYEGSAFQCVESLECPPDYECVAERCVVAVSVDAARRDAQIDAASLDADLVCGAESLPIVPGVAIIGSTVGGPELLDATCIATIGPERTFRLTLAAADVPATVTVSTDFAATNYDDILMVRSTCTDDATEIRCTDGGGPNGFGEDVTFDAMNPGVFYIVVDSHDDARTGDFELLVTLEPL